MFREGPRQFLWSPFIFVRSKCFGHYRGLRALNLQTFSSDDSVTASRKCQQSSLRCLQSLEAIEKSFLSSEEAGLVSFLTEQGDRTAGEPSAVLGAVSVTAFQAWKLLNMQQSLYVREGLWCYTYFSCLRNFSLKRSPFKGLCRLAVRKGVLEDIKNTNKRDSCLNSSQPFLQSHLWHFLEMRVQSFCRWPWWLCVNFWTSATDRWPSEWENWGEPFLLCLPCFLDILH